MKTNGGTENYQLKFLFHHLTEYRAWFGKREPALAMTVILLYAQSREIIQLENFWYFQTNIEYWLHGVSCYIIIFA